MHGSPLGLKSPAAIGWRHQWWGNDDPALNAVCEDACNQLEQFTPTLLKSVADDWPPSERQRGLLAQFMGLHIVRSDAFRRWYAAAHERLLEGCRDQFPVEDFRILTEATRSDRERSLHMLAMMNKVSTVLASMHWSLLHFDEPLLVTGDQPVCPVPLTSIVQ